MRAGVAPGVGVFQADELGVVALRAEEAVVGAFCRCRKSVSTYSGMVGCWVVGGGVSVGTDLAQGCFRVDDVLLILTLTLILSIISTPAIVRLILPSIVVGVGVLLSLPSLIAIAIVIVSAAIVASIVVVVVIIVVVVSAVLASSIVVALAVLAMTHTWFIIFGAGIRSGALAL
jgi:hypothetical protein